jgi:hypothetical protein
MHDGNQNAVFLKMTSGILYMWSVRDVIKIEKYMLAF